MVSDIVGVAARVSNGVVAAGVDAVRVGTVVAAVACWDGKMGTVSR